MFGPVVAHDPLRKTRNRFGLMTLLAIVALALSLMLLVRRGFDIRDAFGKMVLISILISAGVLVIAIIGDEVLWFLNVIWLLFLL